MDSHQTLTIKTRKKITILCIRSSLFDVANSKKGSWMITTFIEHTRCVEFCSGFYMSLCNTLLMAQKKSQWNAHRPPRKTKNNPSQRIPNVNEITIDLVWDQFKPSYTIIISTITQVIYYILGREAENISLAKKYMVFNIEHLKRLCSLNNSISWSKTGISECD